MSISAKTGGASPVVSIQKNAYAMATTDGQSAEVTMYGDIYEQRPTDWDGNPVEGEFVLLSDFMEDLGQIASCKDITIRMNSYGGDAGVSITIHNRLRELARNGAKLTCIVDGVAMSGGSLIMCACDTVKVNPSSLVMIHKCWTFLFGGYNADEMREVADRNDAWDKAQVSIYKRKTGLSDTVLSHMMSNTTYMTGAEAVEKGFADEVLEDAEPISIAASADGRTLFVQGRKMHLAPGMFAPDIIPTVTPAEGASPAVMANTKTPGQTGKGGKRPMDIKNLAEFREKFPELAAQLEAEANAAAGTPDPAGAAGAGGATGAAAPSTEADDPVQAERKRISEIDAVASLFDAELVQEAKYGKTACSAQELAYRAAQKAVRQGSKFLSDLEQDAKESGAAKVGVAANAGASGAGEDSDTPQAMENQAKADVKAFLDMKEVR